MKPKTRSQDQFLMFQTRLESLLDHGHHLYKLANKINWTALDDVFGVTYAEKGRPGIATRMMAGLHYLKYSFNFSDEAVVSTFVENPYWQYFCGLEYFSHKLPIDPSSMTRWRQRIGPEGSEIMMMETIDLAKRKGLLKNSDMENVVVDTTVMEKAIDFPTDTKLLEKTRKMLVREARRRGISLRQSYARKGPQAAAKQARYAHARQFKRAKKMERKLRTYVGRLIRDIRRKVENPDEKLAYSLHLAERIYSQKRNDKNKLYSLWAPEAECISKGKAHKRYEFGVKVGIVTTAKNNWVVGVRTFPGNPYDGHTLAEAIEQSERCTGVSIKNVFVDKGYRGSSKLVEDVEVHLPGKKGRSRAAKCWMRRRSAVEPIIGHTKNDYRMNHNHLHGQDGDRINALMAACGFNLRKVMRELSRAFFLLRFVLLQAAWGQKNGLRGFFMPQSRLLCA